MLDERIEAGIEHIVSNSVAALGDRLHAMFLFGSGNNADFVTGLSDLDFLYILECVDFDTLQKIKHVREQGRMDIGCKVDIKPFTYAEFEAGVRGTGAFEFFTGWGLEMMRQGKQRCLYNSGKVSLDYFVSQERLRADALQRAHYYITKLRKLYAGASGEVNFADDAVLLDVLKVTASAVKNVLGFCLAYNGVIANGADAILKQSAQQFGGVEVFDTLFEAKKNRHCDRTLLIDAYNAIEKTYARIVCNG